MDEQDLVRMNRVLRHRLRNVASGIKTTMTFLSKELQGRLQPQEMEYFPLIINECDALTDLTGRMSLYFDDVPPGGCADLKSLADAILIRLHNRFPTAHIQVYLPDEPERLRVKNEGWARLIVEELLANAVEAAPGKPIDFRVAQVGVDVQISVQDAGPGAPPDQDWAEWFKPFFTTRPRHVGLGLTIADKLVRKMNGSIRAERPDGGGLCLCVAMPLACDAAEG